MPSYSSPSPPIIARPIDDPRPPPPAQAPLSSSPSAHKTIPTPVPNKPTPIAKVDNGPPPGGKQPGTDKQEGGIDMEVFNQILELDDDDDDDEFSRGMVNDYFSQAEKTFIDMDDALKKKDLESLSSLGHFLKGSSAALGVFKVQSSCEDIQHYGQLKEGNKVIREDYAITKIGTTLARAREEYETAKSSLQQFYCKHDGKGLVGKSD